jgi:hypothetical protein
VAQEVKRLPRKCETLRSKPRTAKNKNKNKNTPAVHILKVPLPPKKGLDENL